jgi:hypothetical protein
MATAALAFAAAHRGAAGRMADDIAGLLAQADPSGAIAGGKREGG